MEFMETNRFDQIFFFISKLYFDSADPAVCILELLFLAGVSTPRGPNSVWRSSIEGVALSGLKAEEGLCKSPVDTLTPHQSAFQSCRLFPSVPIEEAVVSCFTLDKKPQAESFICSCIWFPYRMVLFQHHIAQVAMATLVVTLH